MKIEDWELDAGQIVDDLAPISRLEGDIFYRGYWMLDTGYWMLYLRCHPAGIYAVADKIVHYQVYQRQAHAKILIPTRSRFGTG